MLLAFCNKNANQFVATPLLEECEGDIHTPKMGTCESYGTPKTSEFNCRS